MMRDCIPSTLHELGCSATSRTGTEVLSSWTIRRSGHGRNEGVEYLKRYAKGTLGMPPRRISARSPIDGNLARALSNSSHRVAAAECFLDMVPAILFREDLHRGNRAFVSLSSDKFNLSRDIQIDFLIAFLRPSRAESRRNIKIVRKTETEGRIFLSLCH